MLYMQRPFENLPRRWTQTMRCVRYLLGQTSTQGAQKNEKILSQLFQEHCKEGFKQRKCFHKSFRSIAKKVSKKLEELSDGKKPHIIVSSIHRLD